MSPSLQPFFLGLAVEVLCQLGSHLPSDTFHCAVVSFLKRDELHMAVTLTTEIKACGEGDTTSVFQFIKGNRHS